MSLRRTLPLLAAAGVLAAPATALAAWSAPTTVDTRSTANPQAQAAFGGSIVTSFLDPVPSLSRRAGDGFGAPAPLTTADPSEKAWTTALADDGTATVLTVRKHLPTQRIRAILVPPGGAQQGPFTVSDGSHSAAQPQLSVAADGTAVAAWQWHDPAGWRIQAAIRKPGAARFGAPQAISPPAPPQGRSQPRPSARVAAGPGGHAVLTWQVNGDASAPGSPLHVLTAGADGIFGADQTLPDAGGYAAADLAVSSDGQVLVAYLDEHFSGHESDTQLHVTQGAAGAPLPEPQVLSSGGKGTSSGDQIAAAIGVDGTATVAWAKPGDRYEDGGTLEVFTRAADGAFGAAQTLAQNAEGIVLGTGPGGSAVVSWMTSTRPSTDRLHWTVSAALRPAAGGAFGPAAAISDPARNALWPSVAMTASGDALATWVTNTDGSGGGQVAAAVAQP